MNLKKTPKTKMHGLSEGREQKKPDLPLNNFNPGSNTLYLF